MRTTFALFLVLPVVFPCLISTARPKRQCPCAEVLPMPPQCKCLPGITAQCTCLRPTFQPVCPCAVQLQLSQCRAACLRTCTSTCARSVFAATCPASCGYSCSHSCMHQQVVPIHVVMPKLVTVERCLPVCQQSCTRSCMTVFTVETCTLLCPQPCERRCIKMFPILKHKVTKIRKITEKRVLTVKNCLVPCRPRCEPQCIYATPYPVPTLIEERPINDNRLPLYPGPTPPFQKPLQKPKHEATFGEMLYADPSQTEELPFRPTAQKYTREQSSSDMHTPTLIKENLDQQQMPFQPSYRSPLPITELDAPELPLNNPLVIQRANYPKLYSDQGEPTSSHRDDAGGYEQYPSRREFPKDAPSEIQSAISEDMIAAMPQQPGKQPLGLDEAEETITRLSPTQQTRITIPEVIEDTIPYPTAKTFYPEKDTELQGIQSKFFSPGRQEEFLQPSYANKDVEPTSEGSYKEFDAPSQVPIRIPPGMQQPYGSSLREDLQASSVYPQEFLGEENKSLNQFQQPKLAELQSESEPMPRRSGYIGVPTSAHGYVPFDRQMSPEGRSRFSTRRESVLEKSRLQRKPAVEQLAFTAQSNIIQTNLRRRKEAGR